ncbi:hypothetical protein L596_026747 [Steinernema carpocapsae]|nr:hypothetical protein L596_026747 [Steinernema carpocapsae]
MGLQIYGTTIFLLSLVFGASSHMRILYIFITNKKYRDLQCYRIMIHMGMVQMVFSFSVLWIAIYQVCNCDPLTLGTHGYRLSTGCCRTEGFFELILALNRLVIICDIKCPDLVFVVLTFFAWAFLIAHQVIFSSWMAAYVAIPDYYVAKPDLSLPYTLLVHSTVGVIYEITLLCTFAAYIIIVLHLIYLKWKFNILKDVRKEAKILIYAFVRFAGDGILSIIIHYVTLPSHPGSTLGVGLFYVFNNIILPPFLYLGLCSNIRKEFFGYVSVAREHKVCMNALKNKIAAQK